MILERHFLNLGEIKVSEKKNLYQKLAEIRKNISVKKKGHNSFGNYDYYQIDDIYAEAKKLFYDYNIFTIFSLTYNGETNHYRAILVIIDGDSPESKFSMVIDSPLNDLKSGTASQKIGSNNTYQSKYLYMDLLMLDDGSADPDLKNKHETNPKRPNYTNTKKVYTQNTKSLEEEFL